MKLVWTERARRDLFAIHDYIAQDAPERALKYIARIERCVRKLTRFPRMGRAVAELTGEMPNLREVIMDDYRILYRNRGQIVEVLALYHGRRIFHVSFDE